MTITHQYRTSTLEKCSHFKATTPTLSLRDSINLLCEAFPLISRSWIRRHHAELTELSLEAMAQRIDTRIAANLRSVTPRRIAYADPTGEHASNLATYGGGRR